MSEPMYSLVLFLSAAILTGGGITAKWYRWPLYLPIILMEVSLLWISLAKPFGILWVR